MDGSRDGVGVVTVCVESVAARSLRLSRTQRRCRRAMRPRLEPSGGLWEQHGDTRGHGMGIDEFSRKNVTNYEILPHPRLHQLRFEIGV